METHKLKQTPTWLLWNIASSEELSLLSKPQYLLCTASLQNCLDIENTNLSYVFLTDYFGTFFILLKYKPLDFNCKVFLCFTVWIPGDPILNKVIYKTKINFGGNWLSSTWLYFLGICEKYWYYRNNSTFYLTVMREWIFSSMGDLMKYHYFAFYEQRTKLRGSNQRISRLLGIISIFDTKLVSLIHYLYPQSLYDHTIYLFKIIRIS